MSVGRYVVVPTRDREKDLSECVQAFRSQDVDLIVVIDNCSQPPVRVGDCVIRNTDDPPNISRLWNIGLDQAAKFARSLEQKEWFVAIVNDDVVVPSDWFETVIAAMVRTGAAAGCSDQHNALRGGDLLRQDLGGSLYYRMCGFAHVLRGSMELRYDEDLRWWFGDDDMDWRCRQLGGMVIVPGHAVHHKYGSASTNARPELGAQAGRDRMTFQEKWGTTPW